NGFYSALTLGARALARLHVDQLDGALADARRAADYWRFHHPGTLEVAQSDLLCARVLVRQAEAQAAADLTEAAPLLTSAHNLLMTTHESLLAFGPAASKDTQLARELLDFVSRLMAMT